MLSNIGKEQMSTFGILAQAGKVEYVWGLAFRESRGGEISDPAFT